MSIFPFPYAYIIITYLRYSIFDTQLSTMVIPKISPGVLSSKIVHSAFGFSNAVQNLAIKALRSRRQPDYNIGEILIKESGCLGGHSPEQIHFIKYARPYCLYHTLNSVPMNDKALEMLHIFLEKDMIIIDTKDDMKKLFNQAIVHGHKDLTRLLIQKSTYSMSTTI
ncbi:hypothetical protein F4810DRAFT_234448 [Camillea tinctor]|nr:hypothetical protein F4810DRAFT_234448 [Camillea tinctor]